MFPGAWIAVQLALGPALLGESVAGWAGQFIGTALVAGLCTVVMLTSAAGGAV